LKGLFNSSFEQTQADIGKRMAEYRSREQSEKGSIVFHLHEGVGTLNDALAVIKERQLRSDIANKNPVDIVGAN
jgi:hypothetical protein